MSLISRLCSVFLLGVFLLPYVTLGQASDSFTVRSLYGDDASAPTVPSSVVATPLATTQIDVTWSAATDNVAVAGYKLYRDGVQIATTTLLAYSDTGLLASTTYAYFLQAFDVFGNVSSSSAVVSTTTFSSPPSVTPTSTTTSGVSSVLPPQLQYFAVDPGAESARFTFSSRQPITFTLRYGTTSGLDDGFVQSDVFKKDHATIITDLAPATTYFYEVYGTDRFGRERLLKQGSFKTLGSFTLDTSPNVLFFSAAVSDQNVLLRWGNPSDDAFAYVRVVRSHYFYPQNPTDGYVVYEGTAESFFDAGVLIKEDQQFYTIFTYNIDGLPSSGAVAHAARSTAAQTDSLPQPDSVVLPTTQASSTATTSTKPSSEESAPFVVPIDKIIISQGGVPVAVVDDVLTLVTDEPFMIQVPTQIVPAATRTLIVTWQHPTIGERKTSYLLRRNEAQTYFEAVAAPMHDTGMYPLRLAAFDARTNEIGFISFVLQLVAADAKPVTEENVLYVATTYLIIGGGIGLLTVLGLWWLLMLLIRVVFRTAKS